MAMLHFKSFTEHVQVIGKFVMLEIQHLIEIVSCLSDALLTRIYRFVFCVQVLLESADKYLEMCILLS
jgi:hypothetical protein